MNSFLVTIIIIRGDVENEWDNYVGQTNVRVIEFVFHPNTILGDTYLNWNWSHSWNIQLYIGW